jgi:hypothetical protein
MVHALRYPSSTTLLVATLLVIVPFFWPVTMYVWLRHFAAKREAGKNA